MMVLGVMTAGSGNEYECLVYWLVIVTYFKINKKIKMCVFIFLFIRARRYSLLYLVAKTESAGFKSIRAIDPF